MTKYKKNMSCLLEKGDNTNENRDTTSSDLGKKWYLHIFSFETAEKNDQQRDTTKITTNLKKLAKSKKKSLKMKRYYVRVRKTEKRGRLRRSWRV